MSNDTTTAEELKNPSYYINRELSHISFNERVLNEAFNEQHPLLERVKFLSITASNMDEFFMVRVSGLKQQVLLGISDKPPDGLLPREQLVAINRAATALLERKMLAWRQLHAELGEAGIRVQNYSELKPRRQERLRDYFETEIFPVLTPLALDRVAPFRTFPISASILPSSFAIRVQPRCASPESRSLPHYRAWCPSKRWIPTICSRRRR